MTQQEILNLPYLKIAEVKPNMFVHIHTDDEHRLTTWNDGDDIMKYSGSICMWLPIRDSYDDNYRMITIEEHNKLVKMREEYIKQRKSEINNNTNANE